MQDSVCLYAIKNWIGNGLDTRERILEGGILHGYNIQMGGVTLGSSPLKEIYKSMMS